jgi:hypothetical protein
MAGALIAAIQTELRADLFDRLASADYPKTASLALTEPKSWPDVTVGILLAASGALIGIFLLGLLLPLGRPEVETVLEVHEPEPISKEEYGAGSKHAA